MLEVRQMLAGDYAVVDTGQALFYDDTSEITAPAQGEAFYGQDAQHDGNQPSYTLSADGLTVHDNVTGLTWTQSADLDGDGDIDADDKLSFAEANTYADTTLNPQSFGGYSDWRLPSIKELYSLIDFRGKDPSGYNGTDTSGLVPFIDTNYFDFGYGDTNAGERIIDAQWATSTLYVSTVMNGTTAMFGVNFADGRIKGYPAEGGPGGVDKTYYTYFVRGNSDYGQNQFVDHDDGTITDTATELMWSQDDNGVGVNWEDALAWGEQQNAANYLGHNDWRLPNAKELQSLIDYSRSPDTHGTAAIDPVFNTTAITVEDGSTDYPFYWSGTTHVNYQGGGQTAVYVSFGEASGYMGNNWLDVHGAGAQRSDPKNGDPADYPTGHGPQGDAIRIFNYVRLVRDATNVPVVTIAATDPDAAEAGPDTGTFMISRSGVTDGDLTVQLSVAGPATEGDDYLALARTVVIPDGQSSVDVTLTPVDDHLVESTERVRLNISASAAYTVGNSDSARVFIDDNDTSNLLVGKPTDQSITVNVIPNHTGELYFEYGTASGVYTDQTGTLSGTAGEVLETVIDGLSANTEYFYRMVYRTTDGSWINDTEYSFNTQRDEGESFVFTIASDTHHQFTSDHRQTMQNVLADDPDLHFDLGDTFLTDSAASQSEVDANYLDYRDEEYFGAIGDSVPIFLAPGNHENEEGWELGNTPFSAGLASIQARKMYYPTPIDEGEGGFYTGNTDPLADIDESVYGDELRENYYAFEWGDALFVFVDPFHYTTERPQSGDQWNWTLGYEQYAWLTDVLESSDSEYKFVLSHHVTGGIPGEPYVRGGAGGAPYFEWGGRNEDGSWGFSTERPGWGVTAERPEGTPIHQLFIDHGVSAYFHGHDHEYAYESLDGIVYQSLPGLLAGFGTYDEADPYTHVVQPNAGHLRVTVTSTEATVDYVRSDETGISHSYTIDSVTGASYAVVDTGQTQSYGNNREIVAPTEGQAFYGQDAQHDGNQPSYTLSADGLTVIDNVTGLIWTRSPDLNGDGDIDFDDKLTFAEASTYADSTLNPLNFGGYGDWRLPSIKEMYSLIDFRGQDASSYNGTDTSTLTPFIDTNYFDFGYGDTSAGERIIDAQWATSTLYVSTVMNGATAFFGVNLADGRIKGYPAAGGPGGVDKTYYTYFVRGNSDYGENQFVDHGDGTITDTATELMWSQDDNGVGVNWEDALAWVQQMNDQSYQGYNDWRLPHAKELQSLVDYTRSPDTHGTAAIDSVFNTTAITVEDGSTDYPFFWSGTTHVNWRGGGQTAVYVSFGEALGYMNNWLDVHGAGAQRSDPKDGDPADYPTGHGFQGDAIRIFNYVRLVRDADTALPGDDELLVTSLVPTASGFVAQFNRDLDTDVLNLYDARGTMGDADVRVVGTTGGPVVGSLIVGPGLRQAAFVKTGGVLEPDTYTITLRSADDAFRDTEGNLFDGDGNGVAGGDYATTFTVTADIARVLSLPDFSRGPLQDVAVPATAAGIPVTLSDGNGVDSVDFTFRFDPAMLDVSGITLSDNLIALGWTVLVNLETPGQMRTTLSGTGALPAGEIVLGHIEASVPADAPYTSAARLSLDEMRLNEDGIPVNPDDAVQIVAYFGDATGNRGYSGLDAQQVARVAVRLDAGFEAFPLIDPVVTADVTGNGELSGLDAQRIAQKVVGLDPQEIPDLPENLSHDEASRADPAVEAPAFPTTAPERNAVKNFHYPPSGRVARNERGGQSDIPGVSGDEHRTRPPRALEPDPPSGRVILVDPSRKPLFLWAQNSPRCYPDRLTPESLSPVLQQAIDVWSARPLSAAQESALQQLDVRIVDLPGATLGQALGTTIALDIDAAGSGWFLDATPADNTEYVATAGSGDLTALPGSAAENRVDLLSALAHEIGHVLNYDHADAGAMQPSLPVSTRRIAEGLADDLIHAMAGELNKKAVDAAFAALL